MALSLERVSGVASLFLLALEVGFRHALRASTKRASTPRLPRIPVGAAFLRARELPLEPGPITLSSAKRASQVRLTVSTTVAGLLAWAMRI